MPHYGGPAHGRASVALAAVLLAVVAMVTVPLVDPDAANVEASGGHPLAVVVVGPVGGATSQYRLEAGRIAKQLRSYGARVREVYSPWATWTRVKEAARGANLFVYVGRGKGYPGPSGTFNSKSMNGLGLNRSAGNGHGSIGYYGEYYLPRGLELASDAVVILNRVPYAAGSSEPGRASPTQRTAVLRADNYAAGFLRAGAAAVFASDRSVTTIIRDLFRSSRTMRSVFWNSPWTSSRYDAAFTSRRTSGAAGILAPYSSGRYFQSIVGRLGLTATAWRDTWNVAPLTSSSVRVTSIPALLTALADNAVTEIVVANGTYHVNGAAYKQSSSLWIGARFAGRTRPVLVRAETTGGVIFDGTGAGTFGGITFVDGAHDQTWQGFVFANGQPKESGVIVFGGYSNLAPPHHITLRDITVRDLVSADGLRHGYPIYFSMAAAPGPHDLLIEGFTAIDNGTSGALLHFYHDTAAGSPAGNYNAQNVVIRNAHLTGSPQPIMIWARSITNLLIEDTTITGAGKYAIRYEFGSAITLRRVTSTGSGSGGFYSSLGANPPGVTVDNVSLH